MRGWAESNDGYTFPVKTRRSQKQNTTLFATSALNTNGDVFRGAHYYGLHLIRHGYMKDQVTK